LFCHTVIIKGVNLPSRTSTFCLTRSWSTEAKYSNPLGQVTDAWVRLPVNGTVYDVFSPTGDTILYQVIDEAYVTTYFPGWCHSHTGNITIVLSV